MTVVAVLFCGLTVATDAVVLFVVVFDTGVGLGVGWGSFFFGWGWGLASLSDDSESELLSDDPDDPEPPDPPELLELAELSDLANCFVTKPRNVIKWIFVWWNQYFFLQTSAY